MEEQKQKTMCPLCNKNTLQIRETGVWCKDNRPKYDKDSKGYYNDGDCDFKILFEQKAFKKTLSPRDIKAIIEGNTIKNMSGDMMKLDLDSEYFTTITWKEKNYKDL